MPTSDSLRAEATRLLSEAASLEGIWPIDSCNSLVNQAHALQNEADRQDRGEASTKLRQLIDQTGPDLGVLSRRTRAIRILEAACRTAFERSSEQDRLAMFEAASSTAANWDDAIRADQQAFDDAMSGTGF